MAKKVSRPQTKRVEKYFQHFQEDIARTREERVRLETRVKERKEFFEMVRSTVREEVQGMLCSCGCGRGRRT